MATHRSGILTALLAFGLLLAAGCGGLRPEPAQPPGPAVLVKRADLIELNDYNRRWKLGPEFRQVRYITIHNTAEPLTAAQERDRVNFRRDGMSVSFHFAVDENEAVQILPLTNGGWHAGDGRGPGNTESIGIEICRSQWRGDPTERYARSEENAARLAAELLDRYQLPTDALRRHWDWTGKFCPHRMLEANSWDAFKARVDALRATGVEVRERADDDRFDRTPALLVLGPERMMLTDTGEEFATPREAAERIAALGRNQVLVSSWWRQDDGKAVRDALAEKGIEPVAYFILDPGHPDYERKNLIQ